MPPILSKLAKIALVAATIVATTPLHNQRKRRKEWAKFYLRNRQRYSHMNLIKNLDDKDFRIYLRMSSKAFIELLDLVQSSSTYQPFNVSTAGAQAFSLGEGIGQSHITKSDKVMRQAVSAEERVVATLKFLASGNHQQPSTSGQRENQKRNYQNKPNNKKETNNGTK
ncbi:hypothetical protein PYW08_006055 [Mythimna loreyi]|uniref:Uncharacterized protein n=1 Tax=Mythimna loreyi TaxID=667449 RepID=A0ACC2QM20_9NEOP|nr:hypothetical protein PYW08_006055 [Mythimna loreyi]